MADGEIVDEVDQAEVKRKKQEAEDLAIQKLVLDGDLTSLNANQRVRYVLMLCESLGLNPMTQPFKYQVFSNKLVLYAGKDCSDQLRKIHGVNIEVIETSKVDDVYYTRVRASLPNGRYDEEIGALFVGGQKGEALANLLMKCITKAKRRATLSICGLGFLDETEVASMQGLGSTTGPRRLNPPPAPRPDLGSPALAFGAGEVVDAVPIVTEDDAEGVYVEPFVQAPVAQAPPAASRIPTATVPTRPTALPPVAAPINVGGKK